MVLILLGNLVRSLKFQEISRKILSQNWPANFSENMICMNYLLPST